MFVTAVSRLDDSGLVKVDLMVENEYNLAQCIAYGLPYIRMDRTYEEEAI